MELSFLARMDKVQKIIISTFFYGIILFSSHGQSPEDNYIYIFFMELSVLARLDKVQKSVCTTPGVGVGIGIGIGVHIYVKVFLKAHIFSKPFI